MIKSVLSIQQLIGQKPVDYNGILTFTGTMGPAFGAPGKAGTVGKGEFSFANNSIYSGDLIKG